jgi:hypothetical protein
MQTGQPSQHTRRPPSPHTAHTSPCRSSVRSDFSLGAGGGGCDCDCAGGVLVALGVAFAVKGDDENDEDEDDDAAAAAARAAFGLKDDGAGAEASGDDDVLSALAALANTLDSRILSLGRRSRRALPSLPPLIVAAASTTPIESEAESTMGAVVVPACDTASLPTKADEEDAAVGDEADEDATDDEEEDEEVEAAAADAGGTRGRNGFVRTRKAAIRRAAPRRLIHSGGKSQRPG